MKTQNAQYDPAAALEFFKAGGKPQKIAQGESIFSENSRPVLSRPRMYLLLEGEVSLLAGKKVIGAVKPGEIFGEMAPITDAPRSATAAARTACRVIGLNEREFKTALRKKPGFALMLMSVLIRRIREAIARLKAANALPEDPAPRDTAVFDPKSLADMVRGLSDDEPVFYLQNRVIMQEGQAATRMYAVLEGHAAVKLGGKVVERVGPGGVVGEIALLEQSTRLATVVAETDCTVQPINRNAFIALVKLKPELGLSLLSTLANRLRLLTAKLKS